MLRDRTCIGDRGAIEVQPAGGVDSTRIAQRAGRADGRGAVALRMAGEADIACAADPDVLRGIAVLQAQLAAGRQHQVALQRSHAAGAVDAYAELTGDEIDLVGIHAAQVLDVDRETRRCADARLRCGLQRAVQHLVGAGNHVEPVGPDLAFDDDAAGDQVELFKVAGTEAVAADCQLSLAHVEAGDAAIAVELRLAGHHAGAAGVEKAAAVAADAVRIGDDDIGALASHFDGAAQLRRIVADHFIEDDARRLQAELQVAADPAALLRLHGSGAVVEDQALAADVELLVLVARHAACAGRGDVRDGHAVGRGVHDGPLPGRCARAGRELCVGG